MIAIGIDPGLTGALSVICTRRGLLTVEDLPTCPNGVATGSMLTWIDSVALDRMLSTLSQRYDFAIEDVHVALERPITMPSSPAQTTAAQFDTFGVIRGLLAARAKWTLRCVNPRDWKRIYGLTNDKTAARECAKRCYGNAPVARVKDHNRAEAILIGHWLKREIAG